MSHHLKTILIIVLVVFLGGAAYIYFIGTTPVGNGSALSSSSGAVVATVGTQITEDTAFLSALIGITGIKIDPTLFKSVTFSSLKDNAVSIEEATPGRPNPFAPINQTFDPSLTPDTETTVTLPSVTTTSTVVIPPPAPTPTTTTNKKKN